MAKTETASLDKYVLRWMTDMGDRLMKAMGEEVVKARLKLTPLGRIAYPEDLGHLAVFLVSEKASYITGKVIHMDGGIL